MESAHGTDDEKEQEQSNDIVRQDNALSAKYREYDNLHETKNHVRDGSNASAQLAFPFHAILVVALRP